MRILFRESRREFPLPPFIWTRSSLAFFEETSMPYNNHGGAFERIPLIIYHYVVIVCRMFSVLRGLVVSGRRPSCMPRTIQRYQDGEKKSKVITTTPGNATENTSFEMLS